MAVDRAFEKRLLLVDRTLDLAQKSLVRNDFAKSLVQYRRAVKTLDDGPRMVKDTRWVELSVEATRGVAEVRRARGEYREARRLFTSALRQSERLLGPQHLQTAITISRIGVLCKYEARYAEGVRHYRKALGVIEKKYPKQRSLVASIYHDLGGIEHSRGRYSKGIPFARKSVRIRRSIVGPRSPLLALDLAALAGLLEGKGRFAEAVPIYKKVIRIFESAGRGKDYGYEIAVNLNNLAAILYRRGKRDDARTLFLRSLRLKERSLGRSNPDVAMSLNNLAFLERASGRPAAAKRYFERALRMYEGSVGKGHPDYRSCREGYRSALRRAK